MRPDDTVEHHVLLDALDTIMDAGLAFFSCAGTVLHRSSGLTAMLTQQPDGPALESEMQRFADELCQLMELHRLHGRLGVGPLADRRVQGQGGVYRLRGSYLGPYLFDDPGTILVALAPPKTDPLAPELLRSQWKLSGRQAAVARLLAEGRTNEEIATTLGISPHTARRHTEQTMLKLGARSRAEVPSILLRT